MTTRKADGTDAGSNRAIPAMAWAALTHPDVSISSPLLRMLRALFDDRMVFQVTDTTRHRTSQHGGRPQIVGAAVSTPRGFFCLPQ